MAPIRSYLCNYCGHEFDDIVRGGDPEDYETTPCRCGSQAKVLPSIPAASRGSFGTVRRNGANDKVQKFNFVDEPSDTKEEG